MSQIAKFVDIERLSDDKLAELLESETFSLKRLSLQQLNQLCARLVAADDDALVERYYARACAERRNREARIEKRKAKRLAAGKQWVDLVHKHMRQ